jgi:hypothetical protein
MRNLFSLVKKRFLAIVLFTVLLLTSVGTSSALSSQPPTNQEITFAKETTDLLQAELFAALLQEFRETTPANVEQGKLAISLVFDDSHTNFRLVGQDQPLASNDFPMDSFETQALASALQGQPSETVEKVSGKFFYRRSIPLSNFDPSCVLCHANFGEVNPSQYVGLLALKVPTTNPLTNKN